MQIVIAISQAIVVGAFVIALLVWAAVLGGTI